MSRALFSKSAGEGPGRGGLSVRTFFLFSSILWVFNGFPAVGHGVSRGSWSY